MKKIFVFSLIINLSLLIFSAEPNREFRANWFAAVGVDWPNNKVTTTGNTSQINAQKNEIIVALDAMKEANMNVIFFHIRAMGDAFYPSNIAPWSHYLTNTRGKNPGYDPLAFAIEEAHKRGIELHGWMNPYRYTSGSLAWPQTDYINRDHPEWILDLGSNDRILDPGNPGVRQHIADITKEVIANYPSIDGIVWDDYFYLEKISTGNQDNSSYNAYNPQGLSRGDWRRDNVNKTVAAVYNIIQQYNPGIRFGISPRGIWGIKQSDANQYGVTLPAGITGADNYNGIYCDGLAWLSQGTIDYISPQLYWASVTYGGASGQDYNKLAPWWQSVANKYNRHFYSSMGLYRWFSTAEIGQEMNVNRQNSDSPGAVYFSTKSFLSTSYSYNVYLKNNFFQKQILPPQITWKSAPVHTVNNVRRDGNTLKWDCGQTDGTYAIFAVPNNMTSSPITGFTYMIKRHWTTNNSLDLSPYSSMLSTHKFAVASVNRMVAMSAPKFENGVGDPASITVSVSSLPQFSCPYNETRTATFEVTGTNLSSNITISSNSNAFSVSPATLGNNGGVVTVTFSPSAATTYNGTITIASSGATSKTVSVSGVGQQIPVTPIITTSVSSLPQFSSPYNETRTATFEVTGTDLSSNITISSNSSIFTVSPTTLSKTGGIVTVTFIPTAVASYSGIITVSSTGATSKNVSVSGVGTTIIPQLNLTEGWNFSEQKNNKTANGWDASKVRNMGYGDGKLYLVYETNSIKVVKSQTGEFLYDLSKTDVSGGIYSLCDVGYFDGKAIACNLSTTSSDALKVYVWDTDKSAPRLLLSTTNKGGVSRLGDCIGFTGNWNNGKLSFAYDDGTYTRIINYTITNGVCSTTPTIVYATTNGTSRLVCSTGIRVQPDEDGYWINGKSNALTRLNTSGVRLYEVPQTVKHGNGFAPFNYGGVQYGVLTTFNGTGNYLGGTMDLVDANNGWENAQLLSSYPSAGLGSITANSNCNTTALAQAGSNYVETWVSSDGQGIAYYKTGTPPTYNYNETPFLVISTNSLPFGDVIQQQTKTLSFTVTGENLDGNISISSNSSAFTVNPASLSKTGGVVNVTFKPTAIQTYSGTITISANGVSSKTVSVSGTGSVDPATVKTISVGQSSVYFSNPYNESSSKTVNISGNNLTGVISVSNSNPTVFSVSPSILGTSGGIITITFNPTEQITYTGTLTLSSSGAQNQTIQLTGVGESASNEMSLTETWNLSTANSSYLSKGWDATKVRNMTYGNNGRLYMIYEQSKIKVVKSQTGEELYDLDNTGVSGGTITLCDVAFFDGKVIACNLTSGVTALKIYVWDSDGAMPRVLLNTTNIGGTDRLGDYIGFTGNWNSGKIVFSRDNGTSTKIVIYTITNGVCNPTPTTLDATTSSGQWLECGISVRVQPDANGYWINGSKNALTRLNLSGNKQYEVPQSNVNGNGFSAFTFQGTQYAVLNSFNGYSNFTGGTMDFINANNGWASAVSLGQYPQYGLGTNVNSNCTGNAIGVAGSDYIEAWVLSTLQGIAYYTYGTPPVYNPGTWMGTNNGKQNIDIFITNNLLTIGGLNIASIEVYDLSGMQVTSIFNTNQIDLTGVRQGVYLLIVKDVDGSIYNRKVIF